MSSGPLEDRLESWKEIAAHLRRGVRTVQRWEREEGLPVHRLPHQKLGSVYAYPSELDNWWKKRGSELADNAPQRRRPILRWAAAAAATTLIATANWRGSLPGTESS